MLKRVRESCAGVGRAAAADRLSRAAGGSRPGARRDGLGRSRGVFGDARTAQHGHALGSNGAFWHLARTPCMRSGTEVLVLVPALAGMGFEDRALQLSSLTGCIAGACGG